MLAEKLAKSDGHSAAELAKDSALNNDYLRQAGDLFASKNYRIKSTIDKDVYDRMQFVMRATRDTFGQTYTSSQINPKTGETETVKYPVQNGSVVLDNQTGAVLGFVGGVTGELTIFIPSVPPVRRSSHFWFMPLRLTKKLSARKLP